MKNIKKILVIVFILICVYFGILYFFQNSFLFYPSKKYIAPQQAGFAQFKEVNLKASDGSIIRTWYFEGDKTKPAILFLHGNAGQIATFAPALMPLVKNDYGVLAMEYRSFAGVPGKIRQKVIFDDGATAFDFLKEQGYPKIVVYGYSFGAAFSSGVISLRPADALILTSPFYSLKSLVKEKPVPFASYILKDEYPSYKFVEKFNKPLLIIHGKKDKLIPPHHAQNLFDIATSDKKELYFLEGQNHNQTYFDGPNMPYILDFLKRLEAKNEK
ncbi:MAG: alpha/beta hydrolase [Elusimicrobiaceae bacterium]|nr:alpha/beta hydrolase [Elusimicrobiaceae bacterium]MBQ6224585.1 alpha/beta hydrolase [Campylobacter sp.]